MCKLCKKHMRGIYPKILGNILEPEWIIPPNLKRRKPWQKLCRLPCHMYPVLGVIYNQEVQESFVGIVEFDESTQSWCMGENNLNDFLVQVWYWMPLPKIPTRRRYLPSRLGAFVGKFPKKEWVDETIKPSEYKIIKKKYAKRTGNTN